MARTRTECLWRSPAQGFHAEQSPQRVYALDDQIYQAERNRNGAQDDGQKFCRDTSIR